MTVFTTPWRKDPCQLKDPEQRLVSVRNAQSKSKYLNRVFRKVFVDFIFVYFDTEQRFSFSLYATRINNAVYCLVFKTLILTWVFRSNDTGNRYDPKVSVRS